MYNNIVYLMRERCDALGPKFLGDPFSFFFFFSNLFSFTKEFKVLDLIYYAYVTEL